MGWDRWKEVEERYFLGLVAAGLDGLAQAGLIEISSDDLTARMFLAAAAEAGLAVAAAPDPSAARRRAAALLMRFLQGLREPGPPT